MSTRTYTTTPKKGIAHGISSLEIHRALGVTQKTAWFMLHRIRAAMQSETFEKLSGEVEADETYTKITIDIIHLFCIIQPRSQLCPATIATSLNYCFNCPKPS